MESKTNHALVAGLIRQELKTLFPETKFQVKSYSFAGGDQVDVYWCPGPDYASVVAATKKFEHSSGNSPSVRYVACKPQ
ncbi:MAG TPA: LPD29 domain-containing protein [Ignavibacteriales bacterium]|nr:LPD29 domain-containing protein [Ignavibacteriales bacterium]